MMNSIRRLVAVVLMAAATGVSAQTPPATTISAGQLANGDVMLAARFVMSCGFYQDGFGTTVQREGQRIDVSTRMINLGCAPGGTPPGWVEANAPAGALPDGVYDITWVFDFGGGWEFTANGAILIFNGAVANPRSLSLNDTRWFSLYALLLLAAAYVALRGRTDLSAEIG